VHTLKKPSKDNRGVEKKMSDSSENALDQIPANRDETGKYKTVPPIETRFKPGQTGNPSGRPKKSLFQTRMEQAFNDPEIVELLIADVITAIREGNSANLKEAWARVDGPIKQDIDLNSTVNVRDLSPEARQAEIETILAAIKAKQAD